MSDYKPDPNAVFAVADTVTPEIALNHASDLLRCIIATAGECTDAAQGSGRDLSLSILHLAQMAKVLVDCSLDTLTTA
ncbi:DUF3077 domain-containing protein [Pseudomonas syringae]|nr:DUF3077 domain-containing protein [Pseudomonas syringae]MBD8575760.1 DUF3077 domain-containing protein [Pseudomonas syringae]MBD8791230.1 DUF3077 domain-containing protein [Pseudomonas syringae]MBD8802324.1 DUF3077 domain-containing protein [Pseudomonas syringae]MBD8812851.1 DUF3077 domain-containing protein [Pseudomonas syringae]